MNYSRELIKIRGTLNISQVELGAKLGVSFSTINRWENGKVAPSKRHLFLIEKICDENNIKLEKRLLQ